MHGRVTKIQTGVLKEFSESLEWKVKKWHVPMKWKFP